MGFRTVPAALSAIIAVQLLVAGAAAALPFNSDMVDVQPRVGSVMRPKAPGTVALGSLNSRVESKAEAEKLTNPLVNDSDSSARGHRLFSVNCAPCHSDISKTPYVPSVVAGKGMPGPDLTDPAYLTRTDGNMYGTIHFGGMALMPGYGWKLSPTEHWDIINYIRKIQKQKNGK